MNRGIASGTSNESTNRPLVICLYWTNNRMKATNNTLKIAAGKNLSPVEFGHLFFDYCENREEERKSALFKCVSRELILQSETSSDIVEYSKLLTPFAFSMIQEQIKKMEFVQIIVDDEHGNLKSKHEWF